MVKTKRGLFLFHRDFRIEDNTGLNKALEMSEELYTCFIFTPEQVGPSNTYKSNNAVQFMIDSLADLNISIKSKGGELMCFYGHQVAVLKSIVQALDIDAIYFNRDYTPYAIKRDKETMQWCKEMNIFCQSYSDYYLYEPGTVLSDASKTAYKKYTPFYNKVINIDVREPMIKRTYRLVKYTGSRLDDLITLPEAMYKFVKINSNILVNGGRKHGKLLLAFALREQKNYDETRDFFTKQTTHLSAYIKFGCISIREVYHTIKRKFGLKHGIIRELIWREFFAHVLFAYPEVVGRSYQPNFRNIDWNRNKSHVEQWQTGQTGFPLVDACMREMNTTGYMHNRGRMTTASFLIKTLLIDWRVGEQYFAQQLTDYDIASNNGNWQGISGTGVDMKPYFRDMNPWIQSYKFDINAEYIKKWVPELSYVAPADIHKWHTACDNPKYKDIQYPKPMVDYDDQKIQMLAMYRRAISHN
jgi:deoxyribodipyrimidine photo-lyase